MTRSRRFVEALGQDLAEIRDGIASALPGTDWEPLVRAGKLGALTDLHRRFNEVALAEFGLAPVEQQVLGILCGGTADNPGALARAIRQTAAGMTRTLDRLETRGLVKRRPHREDRRRIVVQLTAKGRKLAERKLRVEVEALDQLLDGLDQPARRRLNAALDELVGRLAEACAAGSDRAA
jgi:DNA-binding MarR family transcriptional regulator